MPVGAFTILYYPRSQLAARSHEPLYKLYKLLLILSSSISEVHTVGLQRSWWTGKAFTTSTANVLLYS